MTTDLAILKRPSQHYRLEFDLLERRHWSLMNVDSTGTDGTAPSADPEVALPVVTAFDGVSSVGTIRGSVQAGGWSADLTIPHFPADFDDYFGVDVQIRTWHGGVPGVPGAAGVDPDDVRLFRGYQQTLASDRKFGDTSTTFPIESSTGFLRRSNLARGWDFASDTPHGAPGTAHAVVEHLLLDHTNYYPRANYGLYFPDHSLTRFSVNAGTLWDMLTSLVGNFVLEPWVFARREDDLYLGCHPNLDLDNLHPNKNSPIIELDDDLLLECHIERNRLHQVASVTITAQQSDQTEYTSVYPADEGVGAEGSHPSFRLISDDHATVDALAEAMYAHLNRRWTAKVKLPLVVAIDLGDVVTVTTTDSQRNITWTGKKMVATSVSYSPVWDGQKRTFVSDLELDELV